MFFRKLALLGILGLTITATAAAESSPAELLKEMIRAGESQMNVCAPEVKKVVDSAEEYMRLQIHDGKIVPADFIDALHTLKVHCA